MQKLSISVLPFIRAMSASVILPLGGCISSAYGGDTEIAPSKVDVLTYHDDQFRTGWNDKEQKLTVSGLGKSPFGIIGSPASLDDQVDAQPLVVSSQTVVTKTGVEEVHDVVYVVTEANSLYAIDASTGKIINNNNFGSPIPQATLPHNPTDPAGQCTNGPDHIGINSTPAIDKDGGWIYFVAYTLQGGAPAYFLHAVSLRTLKDRDNSPVKIDGTQLLVGGGSYNFDASVSRQRPALLLSKKNLYVGFGSFCDFAWTRSRGWVLGWEADSLRPVKSTGQIGTGHINIRLTQVPPKNAFLSSIWMSGAGIASDLDGNLFFVTGNSDRDNANFSSDDLAESVVKIPGDFESSSIDWFTSPDAMGDTGLEHHDRDFGAGGVLVLPDQPHAAKKHLAVALGKAGDMYLLDRDNLGHFQPKAPFGYLWKEESKDNLGTCFCTESYFVGTDGIPRIVASGGNKLSVWKLNTTGASASLIKESETPALKNNGRGFFTSISSDNSKDDSVIIWAVTRPTDVNNPVVTLYAFDARNVTKPLYESSAGLWPNIGKPANSNIVPTVANGNVYVASFEAFAIFGIGGKPFVAPQVTATLQSSEAPMMPQSLPEQSNASVEASPKQPSTNLEAASQESLDHVIYGTVSRITDYYVEVRTRTGPLIPTGSLKVDLSSAEKGEAAQWEYREGESIVITGTIDKEGTMHASSIIHGQLYPSLWPPDK